MIVSPGGTVFKKVAAIHQEQPNGDEIAPHKYHQDDLFDPMRNQAVVDAAGYDGAADDTEGTLDDHVEPYPGDVESTSNPLVAADSTPRKRAILVKKRLNKFRRGKYRK